MNDFQESNEQKQGKVLLASIMVVALMLPLLFFVAIDYWELDGLSVYFSQLGLYLLFYLLAFWGLKRENISLPINSRLLRQAVGLVLVGWLLYALIIHLLGVVKWPDEIQTLGSTPAWKVWAQILSTWFFVGLGEEILFRGYFLAAFWRYFTNGTGRRRTIQAILLSSAFFSLWHLPVRITWLLSGELDVATLLLSLVMLFLLGIGFAYLFVQTRNIVLVGLVHGVMNYPLIGLETQLSFIILLACIGFVAMARLVPINKSAVPS
jgi:membrane protease YdiL (CAAX protease family)